MNSAYPLVSVCMPAYNAEKYVAEAIDSVLNQIYPNIELIVCNDGSTDGTQEILSSFADIKNIKIVNTGNRGQCAAANEAFKNSTGEYIKFFDADDKLNPEHIAEQVARLTGTTSCIATGTISRFYNDDLNTALYEPLSNWRDMAPIDWLMDDSGHGLGMMQCGMFLIPRHLLEEAGLWNESLSLINDFEFFPRVMLNAQQMLFTEKAVVFYRSGRLDTLSNDLSKSKLLSAYNALELTTNRLLKFENSTRVKKVLSISWNLWLYHFYLNETELYQKAKKHLKLLGDHPDYYFKNNAGKLARLIGWKNHKRLKYLSKKIKKLL
ncbi:MAG: glycosyltransferase family 2 protein [Chitinophagaceae bacterium]|nr:glycosyltransferase family 2 protein [Chitinophagaceae bacterium]